MKNLPSKVKHKFRWVTLFHFQNPASAQPAIPQPPNLHVERKFLVRFQIKSLLLTKYQ